MSLDSSPASSASLLRRGASLVRSAASAGASVVKTQVLRQQRTTEEEYQARLDTCKSCPGGHATFTEAGTLHTCGPMLKSITQAAGEGAKGKKPCGCVLKAKARDRAQNCPFSYWPTLELKPIVIDPQAEEPARAPRALPALVTASTPRNPAMASTSRRSCRHGRSPAGGATSGAGTSGGVQSYSEGDLRHYLAQRSQRREALPHPPRDPQRRRFISQSAAAAVGLLGVAALPRVLRADSAAYYTLKKCDDNSDAYVARDGSTCTLERDKVYKIEDKCYTAKGCEFMASAPTPLLDCSTKQGPYQNCEQCPTCGDCGFTESTVLEVDYDVFSECPWHSDSECLPPGLTIGPPVEHNFGTLTVLYHDSTAWVWSGSIKTRNYSSAGVCGEKVGEFTVLGDDTLYIKYLCADNKWQWSYNGSNWRDFDADLWDSNGCSGLTGGMSCVEFYFEEDAPPWRYIEGVSRGITVSDGGGP